MEFRVKSNKKVIFISLVVLVFSIPVFADMFTPFPTCSKPIKPYEFNSQWEIDNFNDDVQRYKNCIQDFVDEQNQAIETHQQAADDAIDEWNRFVNYELN
jgi:protein tyrosine/serine phosphatase